MTQEEQKCDKPIEQMDEEYERELRQDQITSLIKDIEKLFEHDGKYLDDYQTKRLLKARALLKYDRVLMDTQRLGIDIDVFGKEEQE